LTNYERDVSITLASPLLCLRFEQKEGGFVMLCLVDLEKGNVGEIFPSELPDISLKRDQLLIFWLNSITCQIIHPGRENLAIIYHSNIKAISWAVDGYVATHFVDYMEDREVLITDTEKMANGRCFFAEKDIKNIWPLPNWETVKKTAGIIDDFIRIRHQRTN